MRLSRMNRPTSYSSTTPTPPCICSARRQTRTAPSVPYHFTSGVSSRRSRAACSSWPNSTRSCSTAAVYARARAPVTVVSMSSSISATIGCSRMGLPIWTRCAAYSEAFSNAAVATPMPWIPTPRRDSFMNVRICFHPSGLAERRRACSFEEECARRRAADHELVLRPLDDVVVVLAVGDEHAQAIKPARALNGAREHDHQVALPRRDELLAALQDPAAVLPRRRRRREAADIRAGLRLGHRDRTHDLALRERREIARLLPPGAVPADESGGGG